MVSPSQAPSQTQQPAAGTPPAASPPATSPQGGVAGSGGSAFGAQAQQAGLNIVVLDPAHGGTDPGARGTGGIRESEIVLDFTIQVRRALELQGFQVVQTRQGNENPSFDDRSATANAQRGAVFVTLHISSIEPDIWRSRAGTPLPTIQRLARRRANLQRAPASNYCSTRHRRGNLQRDGGRPRRLGPHGAGGGGCHRT